MSHARALQVPEHQFGDVGGECSSASGVGLPVAALPPRRCPSVLELLLMLLFLMYLVFVGYSLWYGRGATKLSEYEADALNLPMIWVCPPDEDSHVVVSGCVFQGEAECLWTESRINNAECTAVGLGKLEVVDTSQDLLISVRLDVAHSFLRVHPRFSTDRDPKCVTGAQAGSAEHAACLRRSSKTEKDALKRAFVGGGVRVVIGRQYGDQWFYASTNQLTAAQLERQERHQYDSPLNEQWFHDYKIFTSSIELPPVSWDGNVAAHRQGASKHEEGLRHTRELMLRISFKSMRVKVERVIASVSLLHVFGLVAGAASFFKMMYDRIQADPNMLVKCWNRTMMLQCLPGSLFGLRSRKPDEYAV